MFDAERYALMQSLPDPEPMEWVRKETARRLRFDDTISGPVIGRLLGQLVSGCKDAQVLELGTFTGYATLWMAAALESGGRVLSIDRNRKFQSIAREAVERSPWKEAIELIEAEALAFAFSYTGPADLIFLDADKASYPDYWTLLKDKLKPGGYLVADNVFWKGDAETRTTPKGAALAKFTKMAFEADGFAVSLLPVRDGLLIARRKY